MKTRIGILLAGFLLLVNGVPATYSQTRDQSDPAMRALTEYDNAWNKKDAASVERLLHNDYVYFSSTGALTTRKATLDFLVSPEYKLTFVERSEIDLLSQSDDIAVISSRWKGRGTYGKEVINDDQRCGLVFVRRGKTWKLLSEHCTQIITK